MEQIQLLKKIEFLPDELQAELNDFVDFLLSKRKKQSKTQTPQFGCAKGKIYTSPDFDEPLQDFKDYMV